jgi:hypothetical protein
MIANEQGPASTWWFGSSNRFDRRVTAKGFERRFIANGLDPAI